MHRIRNLVSVVVTNHNNASYIQDCLSGLLRQSYKNIEIIVVDDASTDKSRSLIRAWKKAHSRQLRHRLTLVELPRNTGFSGAVTAGMFVARGEFIAMHDGDDISLPTRIAKQVAYLQSHRGVGLVGTNYQGFRKDGTVLPPACWLRYSTSAVRTSFVNGKHCVCHGTVMVRGRHFDKIGGLNRQMNGAEDFEWIARYITHGVRAANIPEVLYRYRRHGKQRSNKFYGGR